MATRNLPEKDSRLERIRALEASHSTLHSIRKVLSWFPELDTTSFYLNPTELPHLGPQFKRTQLRIAVFQHSEILDWATAWQNSHFSGHEGSYYPPSSFDSPPPKTPPLSLGRSIFNRGGTKRILVINSAHPEKAGGDWIQSVGTQEDTLCRRSTLYHSLMSPHPSQRLPDNNFYPLEAGGIYSPNVVVFRSGPKQEFEQLKSDDCTVISVASVSPERAPMLAEDGTYLFDLEKQLQKQKMRTALRIAAGNGHVNLIIGMFGSVNREVPENSKRTRMETHQSHERRDINPTREVARMWQNLLENDPEFDGYFHNVLFVVGNGPKASEEAAALSQYFKLPRVDDLLKAWFPGMYDYLDVCETS